MSFGHQQMRWWITVFVTFLFRLWMYLAFKFLILILIIAGSGIINLKKELSNHFNLIRTLSNNYPSNVQSHCAFHKRATALSEEN